MDVSIVNLTFSGGTLNVINSVELSGSGSIWSGGTVFGSSSALVVNLGATLTVSAAVTLESTLDVEGTMVWSGGDITLNDSAEIYVVFTGTIDIQTDADLVDGGTGSNLLYNPGTIEKTTTTGTTNIEVNVDNDGTIDQASGTIVFSEGTYSTQYGTVIGAQFDDPIVVETGIGVVYSTFDSVIISDGVFEGSQIRFEGTSSWTGGDIIEGTLSGTEVLVDYGQGLLISRGRNSEITLGWLASLVNDGTINWTEGDKYTPIRAVHL